MNSRIGSKLVSAAVVCLASFAASLVFALR